MTDRVAYSLFGYEATDADRALAVDSPLAALRRRLDGRYAVDELGGDPHLMDLVAPLGAPVRVHHGDRLGQLVGHLRIFSFSGLLFDVLVNLLKVAVRRTDLTFFLTASVIEADAFRFQGLYVF